MTKEKINEILKTSREDFKRYKEFHKESYLRDAAQKLYEAMLNYGEYKYGMRYTKVDQFRADFYSDKQKIPIEVNERRQLVTDGLNLHEYAYHGREENANLDDLAVYWQNFYNKLNFLVKHS